MPTGVYIRTEEIKIKMRLSHQKGYISSYKQKKKDVTATGLPTDITKGMRGWTKWGGPTHGYLANTPEWYCQCCTEKQTDGLPSYLVPIAKNEYARICSTCLHIFIEQNFTDIFDLITHIRSRVEVG